jgi:hypothetical protein
MELSRLKAGTKTNRIKAALTVPHKTLPHVHAAAVEPAAPALEA